MARLAEVKAGWRGQKRPSGSFRDSHQPCAIFVTNNWLAVRL